MEGATVTEAPTSVVWTADAAHQIGQNEFQTFTISVGRLPAAGTTVVLPAVQRYSDGSTVNWTDDQATDHNRMEPTSTTSPSAASHPAESFLTTAAEPDSTHTSGNSAADPPSAAPVADASSTDGGDTAG